MSYIPNTPDERLQMLKQAGFDSFEDLFSSIPKHIKLKEKLNLDSPKSEYEVIDKIASLADKNKIYKMIFRGAGAYKHFIPSVVEHIASRSEFVTAYTPYQPEFSQGVLQAIFEYQTMICQLTGMDVSNAGVYDGAHAAAEAISMCCDKKRNDAIVFDNIKPNTLEVIKTYTKSAGINLFVLPSKKGLCDTEKLNEVIGTNTACVYIESPNYFGLIEDASLISEKAHSVKAKLIMGCYPIALGLLKTPWEYKADIAVGEAQPLGIPLSFGGPYLGFMATTNENMRKLPGRIVGETTDKKDKRAFVLTLQAREQHIRREKAGSSICSNEALCALRATVYCAALGKEGLYELAKHCFNNAHYLALKLCEIEGFDLKYKNEFFNEFVTSCPISSKKLLNKLQEKNILGGYPLDEKSILWCATEVNTKNDMDVLIDTIKEVANDV